MKTVAFSFLFLISGCLGYGKKEYSFKINSDGQSGKAKICYVDINSDGKTEEEIKNDMDMLIRDYHTGKKLEEEFPFAKNFEKKLKVHDGKLTGEMSFEFDSLSFAGLYRYDKHVIMKFLPKEETYFKSNGKYGGEVMPVVFWSDSLNLKLIVFSENKASDSSRVSLVKYFETSGFHSEH